MEWATKSGLAPLDIALDYLTLGRAKLHETLAEMPGDFSHAEKYLRLAVEKLREAGDIMYIPRGLLARAELYRAKKDFPKAQKDLNDAFTVAERGGMRLFLADHALESAKLSLAQGKKEEAGKELARAKELVEEMGYGRLAGEVQKMEEQLEIGN